MINTHPDDLHAVAVMVGTIGLSVCWTWLLSLAFVKEDTLSFSLGFGLPVFALVTILGMFS